MEETHRLEPFSNLRADLPREYFGLENEQVHDQKTVGCYSSSSQDPGQAM